MPALATSETQDAVELAPIANDRAAVQERKHVLKRIAALAEGCLRAVLIATVIALVGVTFRSGIERGGDSRLFDTDFGTVLYAVCANLAHDKYHAGRYVCASFAEKQMHYAGLWYDDATLARIGKSLPQWEADGAAIDRSLAKVFAAPPLASDGGVYAYGWGGDAGYMDFVQFAFRLFGGRLEALYYAYFLLLLISIGLFCIQFWRNYFALFTALAFQFSIIPYLDVLPGAGVGSLENPRLLSLLAIIPMFHALFLIVYRVRLSFWTILPFVPQAILLTAAADFRSLSYTAVIALTICCLVLLIIDRHRLTLPQAAWRCWPAYLILLCVAAGAGLQARAADTRIALLGGMRYHTFWEPLFWNLETSPDWKSKYRAQFQGATGDAIAQIAVQQYRTRHNLLHLKTDFVLGDESLGLTQVAYEKYTRAAYIEFARKNPWFIAQLKYYNALNVINWVKSVIQSEWRAVGWSLLALGGIVSFALIVDVRRKHETLRRLSICAGLLLLIGIVTALPVWATAIEAAIMTDLTLLNVLASFVLALWAVVCLGVMLSERAPRLMRGLLALQHDS